MYACMDALSQSKPGHQRHSYLDEFGRRESETEKGIESIHAAAESSGLLLGRHLHPSQSRSCHPLGVVGIPPIES
jgi:hypothetical protein